MLFEEKVLLVFISENKKLFFHFLVEQFKDVNPLLGHDLILGNIYLDSILNVDFNKIVNNDVLFDKNKNDFFKLFTENGRNIYSETEIKEAIEVCDDEIVIALDSGELSFEQDEHLMIIAQHINCAELVNTVVDIIDRNSNDYIFLINCIQDIALFGQVLDNSKVKHLFLLFLSFNINRFESWFNSCEMSDADGIKFTLFLEKEFIKLNGLEQRKLH